jgi:predicted nucleic acid-binding protein
MQSASTESPEELIDTNVLLYAYDPSEPSKHAKAIRLIEDLSLQGRLVVSVQVLNEFFVRAIRPGRAPGLSAERARGVVERIIRSARVLPLTAETTTLALEGVARHQLSFWDALIWAATRENGITLVHTEDLPSAPEIEGVRFSNPFEGC